jgi:hypothetical protein
MLSLKDKFDELCHRLDQGRRLESTGSDPMYYLVFPVSEILTVKRQTRAWIAKLDNAGFSVTTFSFTEAVNSVFQNHKLRKQWLIGEKMLLSQAEKSNTPVDFSQINRTLGKALSEGPELLNLLNARLKEAAARKNGVLLLTDLESLHPYLRINSIEARLQGQIDCPIIVFYPGKREGKTSLRFLEFYPADPNYRSEHIG